MADQGAVGGLQPLGDRYGSARQQPHHDGPASSRQQPAPRHGADSIELAPAGAAAMDLLEQRVLAATRLAVPPVGHPPLAIVRADIGSSPAAAVARIQSAQHWCLGGIAAEPAVLTQAFLAGLDETESILHDVARSDAAVDRWLAAVRAIVRP